MADKVDQHIIDNFVRESEILEMMDFDDTVSPTGGSNLVYTYIQEKIPSTASFRAIGNEYTSDEAITEKKSVELKIFGGSFEVDRIISSTQSQLESVSHQIKSKTTAAVGVFHNAMINGDSAADVKSFDGLNKMLVGTATEYGTNSVIDLSTAEKVKNNADEFYEMLLKLINSTNAHAIMVNETMKTKIQSVARALGYKTESEQAFGRTVTTIGENNVRLIDLKNIYSVSGGNPIGTPIIKIQNRTISGEETTGITDIYAVHFDVYGGFCGATVTGDKIIRSFLPDFNQPGAVKKGEVEMIGAVALKSTNAGGVLRNIKVI